jgi:hypothetical protein
MSGPLGERVRPPGPSKKPRIIPVPGRPGIWQDQQGRMETWIDSDTRKPIQPPKKDTQA